MKINKKLLLFQISLIIIFIGFLIFLFSPKNYTKNYSVKDIKITESYNKKNKAYYFKLNYQDYDFDFLFEAKYKQKRTFIKEIKVVEDGDNFCLIPKGRSFDFKPVCVQDGEVIHYSLANVNLKAKLDAKLFKEEKVIKSYQDISIYNDEYIYLIWNYNGFYYLNKDQTKKIDLFTKEFYTINNVGYTKDYLVIPDLDTDYTFNNFKTISFKDGKVTTHKLKFDLYFDSYYPGYLKNKLYIVDSKENTMYEFNAKNGKIEKRETTLYNKGEWEKANIKNVIATKPNFIYKSNYHYELIDGNLYLQYQDLKTLINKDVKTIVRTLDKDIFYLKDDKLYHFNPDIGEELLLSYFEWNFNYNNMIYLELPK